MSHISNRAGTMIELKGVKKFFGEKKAVDGIDLFIPKGELFCFLGPNGAGKTTTLKMLCGLLQPTEGEVLLDGMTYAANGMDIRKRCGYIPDTPFIYERLTCEEFFRFVGDLYRIPREQVDAELGPSFELFGLVEHQAALVKDLSHGLRQRLIYSATLLQDPDILFVDEPFIGLDPYSIRLIKDLMQEKTRNGMTVLLTTHILALAEDMADRIGIISNGKMVGIGTLDELMEGRKNTGRLEDLFLELTI